MVGVPVAVDALDGVEQLGFEPVTEFGEFRFSAVPEALFCEFRGFAEGDDLRHGLRSSAAAIFLATADQQRLEGGAGADVERANTFRGVEFVAGDGEVIDVGAGDRQGDLARGVDGVGVEQRTCSVGNLRGLAHRHTYTSLVVGPHQRDEGGIGADRRAQVIEVDAPARIDG